MSSASAEPTEQSAERLDVEISTLRTYAKRTNDSMQGVSEELAQIQHSIATMGDRTSRIERDFGSLAQLQKDEEIDDTKKTVDAIQAAVDDFEDEPSTLR